MPRYWPARSGHETAQDEACLASPGAIPRIAVFHAGEPSDPLTELWSDCVVRGLNELGAIALPCPDDLLSQQGLEGTNCLVMGGANLAQHFDHDPRGIEMMLEYAQRRGIPVFIYGGTLPDPDASTGWRLLENAVNHHVIRDAFLCDVRSQTAWSKIAGSRGMLVRDPVLIASRYHEKVARYAVEPPSLIGIHLSHSDTHPEGWLIRLVQSLRGCGFRAIIFNDGSVEAEGRSQRLRAQLIGLEDHELTFLEAHSPADFIGVITATHALVTASPGGMMAAYSYGVPFLGLATGSEVDAFSHSIDRPGWICRVVSTCPEEAARQLEDVIETGIPVPEQELVIAQAQRGLAALHKAITMEFAKP